MKKHPNRRDVPLHWPHSFAHSRIAHEGCGCGARACTPGQLVCGFPPRTVILSTLLNAVKISWGSCLNFGINSTDPNFQCGYLDVLLDYHDSSAGNARLAVAKYAAAASKKLGAVFFNPGDPTCPSLVVFPLISGLCRWTWWFGGRGRCRTRTKVWSRIPGSL